MKPLKDKIKNELADQFDLNPNELVFLAGGREDSDGVVFTTIKDDKKLVFKISQASNEIYVKNILEFAHYLGNCGIHISSPLKNKNGNIYEVAKDGDTLFIATLMEFIDGDNPDVNELQNNPRLIYEWGKLTGKMHKAAKDYPIWKNVCEEDERFGFEAEIDEFWLDQLGVFLQYRRLLLYTVLQGWLTNDKKADEAFLNMIEHPCELKIYSK